MKAREPRAEHHISCYLHAGSTKHLTYSARSVYDNGRGYMSGTNPGDDIVITTLTESSHGTLESLATEIVGKMPHPVVTFEVWPVSPEPTQVQTLGHLRVAPKRLVSKISVGKGGKVSGQGTPDLTDLARLGDIIYRISVERWAETKSITNV